MCLSHLGQIAYGTVATVAVIAFSVALGTDVWVKTAGNEELGFMQPCVTGSSECKIWQEYLADHQVPVFILLGLSIALVASGAIYNFTTFFCICCRSFFLLPLLGLALASVLTSGPLLYLVYRGYETLGANQTLAKHDPGYSFYIAGAGGLACVINIIVGAITLRWT
ncbi:unnamed protein product [Bursaphelenchus xylophilus]|uniref:(pine wood nematode) hypothetical protein n=1 Tax=Bursaphelenchus xylophilus TaxID=6326 RepID=A0A1I7RZE9_BURXY|nr:unnamed protein product [Bursaphelenchus xylophilus]CAG9106500.1 unnamed protein product [Bursaphelenchus xylophilus]